MKVEGIPMILPGKHGDRVKETTTRLGLYEFPEDRVLQAKKIIEELKEIRDSDIPRADRLYYQKEIFWKYREWVTDDSMIISRIQDHGRGRQNYHPLVITSDRKLCRRIVTYVGCSVHMIEPKAILRYLLAGKTPEEPVTSEILDRFAEKFRTKIRIQNSKFHSRKSYPDIVLIDTGSAQAACAELAAEPGVKLRTRTLTETGINRDGKRYARHREAEIRPLTRKSLKIQNFWNKRIKSGAIPVMEEFSEDASTEAELVCGPEGLCTVM